MWRIESFMCGKKQVEADILTFWCSVCEWVWIHLCCDICTMDREQFPGSGFYHQPRGPNWGQQAWVPITSTHCLPNLETGIWGRKASTPPFYPRKYGIVIKALKMKLGPVSFGHWKCDYSWTLFFPVNDYKLAKNFYRLLCSRIDDIKIQGPKINIGWDVCWQRGPRLGKKITK